MRNVPSWSSLGIAAAFTVFLPASGACAQAPAPVKVQVPRISYSYVVLVDAPGNKCKAFAKDEVVDQGSLVIWERVDACKYGDFEAKDLTVKVMKDGTDVTSTVLEYEIFHVRSIVLYVKDKAPLGRYKYQIEYKDGGTVVDPQLLVRKPSLPNWP